MAINSVRELARSLGLSHTTVSDALRDSPRVRRETKERVLKAAEEAGYRYNPLAGALMSEMRRSSVGIFRGVIAVVDLESEAQRQKHSQRYHSEILQGAQETAKKLGFKLELFVLGRDKLSLARLESILISRGIRGILILPAGSTPNVVDLDWSKFAGIYTDYIIETPPLDSVCSDHFRSMVLALHKLRELRYKRPGLVLHEAHDRRLLYRWEAAYRTYHIHHDDFEQVEPLVVSDLTREHFMEWFEASRPDVVLCHRAEVIEWMKEAGAVVPETHGFCCLNVMTSPIHAAGLDLQPRVIGKRGAASLIAQIHRNDYGIPDTASTLTIPSAWRNGPTLKEQKRSKRALSVSV
jgi:LacI family transcriptional regulator